MTRAVLNWYPLLYPRRLAYQEEARGQKDPLLGTVFPIVLPHFRSYEVVSLHSVFFHTNTHTPKAATYHGLYLAHGKILEMFRFTCVFFHTSIVKYRKCCRN